MCVCVCVFCLLFFFAFLPGFCAHSRAISPDVFIYVQKYYGNERQESILF